MSDDEAKKEGGADQEEQEMGLTKEEQDKCWEAFSAFDKDGSGFIDANELKIVLEMMGQKTTEEEIYRMIAEADAENTGRITYAQFVAVIAEQKKNQSSSNEEDTLDAFVALGGDPDGGGYINAQKLIKIIKEEFEMTIDIEKLILDIDEDGSGKIEYGEFQQLLSSSD